jgi:hypothetical protein
LSIHRLASSTALAHLRLRRSRTSASTPRGSDRARLCHRRHRAQRPLARRPHGLLTWEGWLSLATVIDSPPAGSPAGPAPTTCAPTWSTRHWPTR